MQAMVHAKTCIQCGLCPAVCPDVFTLDPGEPARAISGPVPEECRLAAQEAADKMCIRDSTCAPGSARPMASRATAQKSRADSCLLYTSRCV